MSPHRSKKMLKLHKKDIFTRVSRYNLIREGRMIYIDVHQAIQGSLAAPFVAVPNLVNIVARPEHQGTDNNEKEAVEDCIKKIKGIRWKISFPPIPKPHLHKN